MRITHVRYSLYDAAGNHIETRTDPLAIATKAIADFIDILVVDPDEDGEDSAGGRISFEPATTPVGFQFKCPGCGVDVGQEHDTSRGCDVEQCPECGCQALSCRCTNTPAPLVWTGLWPGAAECAEFGWWAVRNPNGPGWIAVPAGTAGAVHDLNRLRRDARWDKLLRGWVKKDG